MACSGSRGFRPRSTLLAAALCLPLAAAGPAFAQTAEEVAASMDPAAMQAMDKMSAYLLTLGAFVAYRTSALRTFPTAQAREDLRRLAGHLKTELARIVADDPPSKLDNLVVRESMTDDPEDYVLIDWSGEWTP